VQRLEMFIFVSRFYISNIFERFYIYGMDTSVDHIVSRKEYNKLYTHRVWEKRATISLPLTLSNTHIQNSFTDGLSGKFPGKR